VEPEDSFGVYESPSVALILSQMKPCTPCCPGNTESLYLSTTNNCASLNRCHSRPLTADGDKVRREEAQILPFPVPEPWAGPICLDGCTNMFSTLWVLNCSLRIGLQRMGFDSRHGQKFFLFCNVQIGSGAHLAAYPVGTERLFTPGRGDKPPPSDKVKNTWRYIYTLPYVFIACFVIHFDIVMYRPVAKQWLCKERPLLGNARKNRTTGLRNPFLNNVSVNTDINATIE
jgi:hypothetical protein